jgi:hypothetical protein
VRLFTNQDCADRRGRLQPRGGVDDIARNHGLAQLRAGVEDDQGLARVDGDSHLQVEAGIGFVPLRERVADG